MSALVPGRTRQAHSPAPTDRPRRAFSRATSRTRHTRTVVAAVADSSEAVAVARVAAALAGRPGHRLVLGVALPVPARAIDDPVAAALSRSTLMAEAEAIARRVRPVLDMLGAPYRVEVVPYRDRGGPRRRARRVASALLRLCRQVGADHLVAGRRPQERQSGHSVSRRLAHAGFPRRSGGVEVTIVASDGTLLQDPHAAAASSPAAPVPVAQPRRPRLVRPRPARARPAEPAVLLTEDGRRRLERRAERLREQVLPELRDSLADRRRDGRVDQEYHRVTVELAKLEELLAAARPLPAPAVDDGSVRMGQAVVVALPDRRRARVRLVHPAEASLDGERISVDSPLARALLGHRAGDVVEVPAPAGAYSCRVEAVGSGDLATTGSGVRT